MGYAIQLKNVSKKFKNADYYSVDHVSIDIAEGEFVTILGASGCGKTTLLKMINRLYEPDEGEIVLFGENVRSVDIITVRRRIGYVIQQVGLFPHMTVAENIATVPKLVKWDKEKTRARVNELMELVGLPYAQFAKRYPAQLSGGQQQRVGVARALAADPKIMLLDEPFGAIDSITRSKLQDELKVIHGGLKKTFLFVTHDIEEAFRLGTKVIVMNKARIVRYDTPANILRDPQDEFVASLVQSVRNEQAFWEQYHD